MKRKHSIWLLSYSYGYRHSNLPSPMDIGLH